jgi:hypothetical protein
MEIISEKWDVGNGTSASIKKKKYVVLGVACILIIVGTLIIGVFPRNIYVSSVVTLTIVFGYGMAIYSWCRFDSRENNYQRSEWVPYMVVLFCTLTLVYYLCLSRGFLHGLRALVLFVMVVVGMLFVESVFLVILGIALLLLGKGDALKNR